MRLVNPYALLALLLLRGISLPAEAGSRLTLVNGELSVEAERCPLSEVLAGFAHYGIDVNFDPGAEMEVDGVIPRQPVDDALRVLLQGAGYVTRWGRLESPEGTLHVLRGIDVFRRGYRATLAPLPVKNAGTFAVVKLPDGREIIRDEILLGLRAGVTGEQFRSLVASVNGTVLGVQTNVGVYRIKLPPGSQVPSVVEQLLRHPQVGMVEPNFAYRLPVADSPSAQDKGSAGGLPPAPSEARGSAVALLDSGLLPSLDLGGWVVARHDATDPGATVNDSSGHGSQMALIATGAVQPGGVGVPNERGVPVVAVKAFDANGVASSFSVMESLRFARENGARVASLSWGTDSDSGFLRAAVAEAQQSGMVIVAAAGNVPSGKAVYPAAYPGVVAVGALLSDGTRWERSNYGDFLTATAPGTADLPVGHDGPPGAYVGTSISTPWVARAFSQYFEANPTATAAQAVTGFKASLQDAGATGRDPYYGNGVFDRAASMRFISGK